MPFIYNLKKYLAFTFNSCLFERFDEQCHQLEQLLTGHGVLRVVWGDIFEGPLYVLMLGQLSSKDSRLDTAHLEQAVIGR